MTTEKNLGPHGLGDPDDKRLRHVEKDILIPRIMERVAHNEYCSRELAIFNECGREKGFFAPFKCMKQGDALKSCIDHWLTQPEVVERCTKEYLEQRSEYRRTGKRRVYEKVKY